MIKPSSISIVIPTYNRAHLLVDAIESALAQTVACQVIVVDHGSTDETPVVAGRYEGRVTYLRREEDSGPCIAWLDGIIASTSEYVHLTFDDDWIAPEFAAKTLSLSAADVGLIFTNAAVVRGDEQTQLFASPSFVQGTQASSRLLKYLIDAPFTISPGCAVFRRKDALDALMTNPAALSSAYHGAGPDLMMFLLCLSRYKRYAFVAETLSFFREHDQSITIDALRDPLRTKRIIAAYAEYKAFFMLSVIIKQIHERYKNRLYGFVRFISRRLVLFKHRE